MIVVATLIGLAVIFVLLTVCVAMGKLIGAILIYLYEYIWKQDNTATPFIHPWRRNRR